MKRIAGILIFLTLGAGTCSAEEQQAPEGRLPLRELRMFTQVFEQIRRGYVEEIDDTQLLENAIAGMLLELDPHSVYMDEKEYSSLQEETSGEYGGLGMEVGVDQGLIKVIAPIDDTPAARAGIQPGDLILEMDGVPVRGTPLQKAIDKLRGRAGSKITLTILREGEDAPLEFKLKRDVIHVSSIRSRMLEPGFGYVRIAQFQTTTGEDFVKAIKKLAKESRLKGMVLDLRNNPGGLVPAAVDVADSLIDSGNLVYTEGRLPSANQRFDATPGEELANTPLVVLINSGSASASEIVAGALQDHRRAVILGTRSFGKGSVQTVIPLGDGRAIKLTTARYYTPNGRSIQAEGIVPDITVERAEIRKFSAGRQIREADLEGHLVNASSSDAQDGTAKEDLTTDNQLFEALNLLKGFSLLGKLPINTKD